MGNTINILDGINLSQLIVTGITTVAAGSTAAPSISPTGDTDTGIFFPSADTIAFGEGGSEAARIDSSGRFGIGTISPLSVFDCVVGASGARRLLINYDNSLITVKGSNDASNPEALRLVADNVRFNTGTSGSGTERLRIDSSGRLLLGTSSSLLAYAKVQVQGGISDQGGHICLANDTASPVNGENIGSVRFTNNAGGVGAIVGCEADGAWTAGSNYRSRLVFATTADGASSPTERMRIGNDGAISIQSGAFVFTTAHLFIGGSRMPYNVGNLTMQWSDTTGRVSITTSTRILKKNIEDSPYGITAVKALQPRTYTIHDKEGESEKVEIGFIADEVADIIPEIVPWSRKSLVTGNDKDEELIPISVQYDRISVVLVKALQEAIAKIETLEAKVAALESA